MSASRATTTPINLSIAAGRSASPVPGFEAKIVDPDTGAALPVGEVGELWLRSPFLMEGYYGRERAETFTADGWYGTGDLFHVDADGFFYFTGRRGDMIKTAGANVSPREVEAAIADLTGLVAHVVGIDDHERGQLVAAALRVPAGQTPPDTDALRTELRDPAVGLQGAAALPRARRRRPDALERQARRARVEGAVPHDRATR